MTDLLFGGGNNIAGLYQMRCIPIVGVQTLPIPAPSGPIQAGAITLKSNWSWITLYGTEQTKSYSEEESETDNGPLWTVKTSLFLPGDAASNRQTLFEMSRHLFVVECQDNAGLWRRLGTQIEGMSFSYSFGVDAQMGGRRGATLTFSGTLTAPPPILTGE